MDLSGSVLTPFRTLERGWVPKLQNVRTWLGADSPQNIRTWLGVSSHENVRKFWPTSQFPSAEFPDLATGRVPKNIWLPHLFAVITAAGHEEAGTVRCLMDLEWI